MHAEIDIGLVHCGRAEGQTLCMCCQTTLVETFRKMYQNELNFEGNRAIIFEQNEDISVERVKV